MTVKRGLHRFCRKYLLRVVEQELGRLLETGVPDLLFRPLERWMIGHMHVDDLWIRELHDDEDVENTKRKPTWASWNW